MASLKGVAAGAAIGTLLGSLAIVLYPKRKQIIEAIIEQKDFLPGKARDYIEMITDMRKSHSKPMNGYLTSGLAGLFIGAGIALAMAPKSGKQFRNQFIKTYNDIVGKTQDFGHFIRNNSHPVHMTQKKKTKRVLKSKH